MLSNYIVRTKNSMLSFYYTREAGILFRVYEKGKWGKERVLLETARDNYTVGFGDDGVVYLFCQDYTGDIMLCSGTDGDFKIQTILKNQSNKIYTIQLNPIISKGNICLIYNLPEDNTNYIVTQQNIEGKSAWSPASRIDKFHSLSDCMFTMQQVSGEHHVLFYQTRGPEFNLGYREITPARQGAYHVFHTTNYTISDTSFLTTDNAIHTLYVVKSMFSNQIIYRKKESDQFSNPIVLFEAQKIDNCLLSCINSKLYAFFMSNEQMYHCISSDGGKSFSKPLRYRNKICLHPVKACYVSEIPMSERSFYIRQVYIDKSNPHDIQLIPDLYDDFYPMLIPELPAEPITVPDDELNKLRSQLDLSQRRNIEKDQQIMYLTGLLQKRNEDKANWD